MGSDIFNIDELNNFDSMLNTDADEQALPENPIEEAELSENSGAPSSQENEEDDDDFDLNEFNKFLDKEEEFV